jgi:putative nucleotidyltransferase with HDIG domain
MSSEPAVLLISDRPDRSRALAHTLGGLCTCRTVGLYEQKSTLGLVTVVITDVGFRHPPDILRLRRLLLQPRIIPAPIIAVLRDSSHLERVQAMALGATALLPANASVSDISAVLLPIIRSALSKAPPTKRLTPLQNIERARLQFGAIFGAAARGEVVSRTSVDDMAESVITAIADGGIRQWLEVVWTYDDTTYQHCLLVTGLAAEFAASLRFARNDQQHVIRGALLHDLGKAKIPLAILNKPGALTSEEVAVMRTHVGIGCELLRGQGGYEPELLEVVLRHHELLDGSGYPDGLVGSQIKDLVRLVTICDIYAALKVLQEMEGKPRASLRASCREVRGAGLT